MLTVGQALELEYRVREADLASALSIDPSDDFPAVFATSRMVALLELAAARLMKGELGPGELSVGVGVEVKHHAATLSGETVRAKATFIGMDGKFFRFAVELFDPAGLAGSGQHTRAIVRTGRLLEGAQKRASQPLAERGSGSS
jgi:predicted thioesterase